ncbi:MAG: bifunctional glutamate N-acetyltransferase/amino-acid acetyltransferase ArgJ [Dehalococcoidales bacterium]|nr:bifunctional glutamate N-acetyltransferase/amino-acid acetyltransferase ArgJ [Dehalococcoidales bacterium]
MEAKIELIPEGNVTSPEGFFAGATSAGINRRAKDKPDLGILFSEASCVATALFTTNRLKAAPVVLSQQRLKQGRAGAVVVNSGCANAFTGEKGLAHAAEMAKLVAEGIGISAEDVLVASTGVIGLPLPMKRIRSGIDQIILSRGGGHELARAMMTTDTFAKETAVKVGVGDSEFAIGGVAKGSGMIHPELATLLCFITTDAAVEKDFLQKALKKAVDVSFNMISIDGDTSPSDMVLLMANGLAGSAPTDAFQQALERVCIYLAKCVARDGEGATKLIEVTVGGALSLAEARLAARTVISSPLVKAAVHGADPNWGRVMAAVGRSGVEVVEAKLELYIGDIPVVKAGAPLPFNKRGLIQLLKGKEVSLSLNLNLGSGKATAWGCDLSEEYVTINSQYMT